MPRANQIRFSGRGSFWRKADVHADAEHLKLRLVGNERCSPFRHEKPEHKRLSVASISSNLWGCEGLIPINDLSRAGSRACCLQANVDLGVSLRIQPIEWRPWQRSKLPHPTSRPYSRQWDQRFVGASNGAAATKIQNLSKGPWKCSRSCKTKASFGQARGQEVNLCGFLFCARSAR